LTEADALERLRDTDVAAEQVNAAAPRIKSEEGIKMEEYQPLAGMREMCAQVQVAMRERNADSSSPGRVKQESEDARVKIEDEIKREYQPSVEMRQMHPHVQAAKRERNSTEHREDAEPRVKTETTVKQEDGITEQNFLWEHEREGRKAAVKSENTIQVPVKPEPVDVPMPMPPPPNRRFDPFDGYEPDYGGGSVKREDGAERELQFGHLSLISSSMYTVNTRQPPMSSRYPSSGVKQEEIGQRRAPSRTYSPGVKQEYGSSGYAARGT
jgi:hypothetical protein